MDASAIPKEVVHCSWEASIGVLSNPAAWRGVALSLGGGALALGILFSSIIKSIKGFYFASAIFAVLMFIFILVGGVIDIFGGFRVSFILTSNGIWSISGKGARAAAQTAIIGGILTGSLVGMAAGSLAKSEQNIFIPYSEVTKVQVNSRHRYILVKGDWSQKPIGLYCDKDNFSSVLQFLQERCLSVQF